MIEERAELVSALVQNGELQASFLALVTARGAWDNVKELSDYVSIIILCSHSLDKLLNYLVYTSLVPRPPQT